MSKKSMQRKIAIINDLSGFGRCSLSVQLPILSAMGIQTCPIPTGIFSNHTGYQDYTKKDLTGLMPEYMNKWKNNYNKDKTYYNKKKGNNFY